MPIFLSPFYQSSPSPLSAPLVADTKSFLQFPSDHFSLHISQSLLLSSSSLLSIFNTFCLHQFNKLLAVALWLGQKATQLINSIFATLMEKGLFSTVGIQYLPHAGMLCLKGQIAFVSGPMIHGQLQTEIYQPKKAAQLILDQCTETAHLSIPQLA